MHTLTKIALIREGKTPPDRRVAFDPRQCREILDHFPVEIVVQPSPIRCFSDQEYQAAGITVSEHLNEADLFFGIKEVPIAQLRPGKTYLFFSHTVKKQPHNRDLLRAVLEKKITLIDYELLTDERGQRLVAFGYYAGVVGAHNTLYAFGKRSGLFRLPRMKHLHDYAEALDIYRSMDFPPCRIVVTGTGRVGKGVVRVLTDMGFRRVSPQDFLMARAGEERVFTVLASEHYVQRTDGGPFDKSRYYAHPEEYRSAFAPYAAQADIFINAILWKPGAPAFFTLEDMQGPEFAIQVIGDITCDIAPVTSVPATIRASTIDDPVFGFDPHTGQEIPPYQTGGVDMMTIDNLPSELPRDAATAFGAQLLEAVLPELLARDSPVIARATIATQGRLTAKYAYLKEYVEG
jgi:saccharopine dehydrogenase (NAD+, L-lysine forming)